MEIILTNGEMLYNIAAGLGFIAYLMTNVLLLRTILILGAGVYIYTGILLNLNSMTGWHIAYGVINIFQVIFILLERKSIVLPESIRRFYIDQFHCLKPKEFQKMININIVKTADTGIFLSIGDNNNRIYLILDDDVMIEENDKDIAHCGPGDFLGEMSALSGQPICANVIIKNQLRYVFWDLEDLSKIERRNLSLYNRFMMVVSRNLVKKLRVSAIEHAYGYRHDIVTI